MKALSTLTAAAVFASTLVSVAAASAVFAWRWSGLRARGVDLETRFRQLPPD